MTEPIPSPFYKDGKFQGLDPVPKKEEEQVDEKPEIFFEFSSELRAMMEEELEGRGFVYIVLDDSIPCKEAREGRECKSNHKFIGWSLNIAMEEVMNVVKSAVHLFDLRKRKDGNNGSTP